MTANVWGGERQIRLRQIADIGGSMAEAAEEFGVSTQRICQIAARYEINFDGRRKTDAWRARWLEIIGPMKDALRAEIEADLSPIT